MFDNTKPNVILLADTDMGQGPLHRQLGVGRVAHELRVNGFEVAVINYASLFTANELLVILERLISKKTLFVGVNNLNYDANRIRTKLWSIGYEPDTEIVNYNNAGAIAPFDKELNGDFIDFIHQCNPDCKLVLGGPYAADIPAYKDFDFVVCGYADYSVVNLANHLAYNAELEKSYKSVYGFTVVKDTVAEKFDFINSITEYQPHDVILPGEILQFEFARGCIFNCAFCSFPMRNKKDPMKFLRNPEVVLKEFINNYEQFGITKYRFIDDTFNDSVEKVQLIHEISKKLPFELEYWAFIRIDLLAAHPETIDLLVESGLRGMYFGIESWNQKTGPTVGKRTDSVKHIEVINYIKEKYGSQVILFGNFIIGLPHETMESVQRTYELLTGPSCKIDTFMFLPLWLYDDLQTNAFASSFSLNFKDHGYQIIGNYHGRLIWKNDHMDYHQAARLAFDFSTSAAENVFIEVLFTLGGLVDQPFSYTIDRWLTEKGDFIANCDIQIVRRIAEYKKAFVHHFNLDGCDIPLVDHKLDLEWQLFYNSVRDPQWPECKHYDQFYQLPKYIQEECIKVHKLPPLLNQLFNTL